MQKFGTTDRRSGPSVISIMAALPCFLPSSAGVAQNSETSGENAKRPLIVYRLDPITNTRVLPNSFPNIPGEEGGELSLAGCRGALCKSGSAEVILRAFCGEVLVSGGP